VCILLVTLNPHSKAPNILATSSFAWKCRTVPVRATTVHVRSGSVAPLINSLVADSRPSRFTPELKASVSHRKGPEPIQTLCPLIWQYYITCSIKGVFKKRPNFLNSSPTSTEGALRLLIAPNGRFWQQTSICAVSLWALVVELHPLNWGLAQTVRRIYPTNSLCTCSVQRM
jgi:hypothetical protein